MKYKIGIIGTGGIASRRHIPTIINQPNLEIHAICDINLDAANKIASQFDILHVFDDYKKMLELDEIDAVHICTPNFSHAPITIDALNAGKHVLVEKPIARTPEEAKSMVDAANKSDKKLMVAHCFRFNSESVCLKKFIDAGELGDIYFARVWALRRCGIPNHGVFTNKEKQGGGPLIDIGVHSLDMALYLMGNPKPISVSGQAFAKIGKTPGLTGFYGEWDYKNFNVEDYAAGFIRLDNGASIIIEASFAANIGQDIMSTTLLGTKGGAQTNPLKMHTQKFGAWLDITPSRIPETDMYQTEICGFYDAIKNNTQVPIPLEQSIDIIKIVDGLYRSSENGKEVTL